ncbi:MAG: DUF1326 domain-containing protein [Candidatus Dormibacteraeota bacterium]|nr:DUF1326 domain-containing protein [Candidatus Dormibacteraeota bacterium]
MIACNCDYGCPCNFNALPTNGHCEGGWIWHVKDGRYGNTDLGGLTFSIDADWPKAIHEGNGRSPARRSTQKPRRYSEGVPRGGLPPPRSSPKLRATVDARASVSELAWRGWPERP